MGINWWEGDPSLRRSTRGSRGRRRLKELEQENRELRERLDRLERLIGEGERAMSSTAGPRARRRADRRAEAEAVAELKAALLRAAAARPPLAPHAGAARAGTPRGAAAAARRPGLWAYCVARDDAALTGGPGVHPDGEPSGCARRLALLCSRVPLDEFGEEPLRRNLNDFAVARAHRARARGGDRRGVPRGGGGPAAAVHDLRRRGRRAADARGAPRGARRGAGRAGRPRGVVGEAAARPRAARRGRCARPRRRPRRRAAAPPTCCCAARSAGCARRSTTARPGSPRTSTPACRSAPSTRACGRPRTASCPGCEGDMVLNGAYLVERDQADEPARARRRARGARARPSAPGSSSRGPFPPYSFVPEAA